MEGAQTHAELARHQQGRCAENDDVVHPPDLECGVLGQRGEGAVGGGRGHRVEPGLAEGGHGAGQHDPPDVEGTDEGGQRCAELAAGVAHYFPGRRVARPEQPEDSSRETGRPHRTDAG